METNRFKILNESISGKMQRNLLLFVFSIFFFFILTVLSYPLKEAEFRLLSGISELPYILLFSGVISLLYFAVLFFVSVHLDKELVFSQALFLAVGTAAVLLLRTALFYGISRDYTFCLSQWVAQMRSLHGVQPLVQSIGDYNMPYLYILFGISKITVIPDLYTIKFVSVVFDFLLAFYLMKLTCLKFSKTVGLFVFFGALIVPTGILNSAFWAQCDSIYVAFLAGFLYYALKEKPNGLLSVEFYALAFSFKLQAIFLAPMLIVFMMVGKLKFKELFMFPAVFIATLLPAIVVGRPISQTFSIYLSQVANYPEMTLNTPSLYGLLGSVDFHAFNFAALMIALIGVAGFVYFLFKKAEYLDTELLFEAAFLFSLIIPYLLPRMHERYFYLADALAVVYFVYNRKRWYVPASLILLSFATYQHFLFGTPYIYLNLGIGAILCGVILVIVLKDFSIKLNRNFGNNIQ